jgi:CubicO group peptidase (beta-lactamase class C family)
MVAIISPTRDYVEAAPEDVGVSSPRLERLTRLVQGYVNRGHIPGAITMVARGRQVIHFETYGQMNRETGEPTRPDNIFRFYSMTKPIASVGLMTLYEEGRFQLDDPVSKFIPEFEDARVFVDGSADDYQSRAPERAITIHDLLRHTSGLVYGGSLNTLVAPGLGELYTRSELNGAVNYPGTLRNLVTKLATLPLAEDPGSRWMYSMSTDVVGYLCEVISGQPFAAFLKERIIDRLQMTDTAFEVPGEKLERFVPNYVYAEPNGYRLVDAPRTSPYLRPCTCPSGGSGLVSTAQDYMRFCKMLAGGGELDGERILSPRTVRFMTQNHLPDGRDLRSMGQGAELAGNGPGVGFGLGFAVLIDPAAAELLGTPGEYYWGGAASTAFFISPAEELIVVFLTQLMNGREYPIRRELRVLAYQALVD